MCLVRFVRASGHSFSIHAHCVLHTGEHQAWQRLHDVAQVSATSNPISSRAGEEGEEENGNVDKQFTTKFTTPASSNGGGGEENMDEDPVMQSAAMLRFGAEVPSLVAAGKCSRTVQFPIPDDWNDPEVRVRSLESKIQMDLCGEALKCRGITCTCLISYLCSNLERLHSAPAN